MNVATLPTHDEWQSAACQTFASPWLDLVLRAGRAHALAVDAVSADTLRIVAEGAELVWVLGRDAQEDDRLIATTRTRRHADHAKLLGRAHADLTCLVRELEAIANGAHAPR